jgi:hypothetical protein
MGISSSKIGDDENPLVVDIKRLDHVIRNANGTRGRHTINSEYIQEKIEERDKKIRNLLNKSDKRGLSNDDIKIFKRNILTQHIKRYRNLANKLMRNETTTSLAGTYREKQFNLQAQLKNLNKVELPNGVILNKYGRPLRTRHPRGGTRTYCAKCKPSCITHRRKGS